MELSIIVPVYNEEKNIPHIIERVKNTLIEMGSLHYELIFIDDGSKDKTLELIKEIRQNDPAIKVVSFSRNFGHQPAVFAGLSYASGKAIVVIDGDLQDPPELIKDLYREMNKGWDVVYAVRKKRKEGPLKKISYWLYYRLLKIFSTISIPLDSGDFCLMRKEVVDQLLQMNEQALFIRGLRAWVGFRQTEFEYERDARLSGEAKYTFRKLVELGLRGIFGFSNRPIKIFGYAGILIILFAVMYIVYVLVKKFFFGDVPEGFTTLVLFISIFGGLQLIGISVLGEYITRIYDETRNRPLFIVKESHFNEEDKKSNHPS
jgi:dolichol-phosphate mannosyltransferase